LEPFPPIIPYHTTQVQKLSRPHFRNRSAKAGYCDGPLLCQHSSPRFPPLPPLADGQIYRTRVIFCDFEEEDEEAISSHQWRNLSCHPSVCHPPRRYAETGWLAGWLALTLAEHTAKSSAGPCKYHRHIPDSQGNGFLRPVA